MLNSRTALFVVAAGLLAGGAAGTARASVTWNGWVNGFGSSDLTYTLVCNDGQVITRNTTTSSGSDTCDDGTNSISWDYGAFWRKNTRGNDRKRVAQRAAVNVGQGQLLQGGNLFMVTGNPSGDEDVSMEVAVLTVPGSQLPSDNVQRTVEDLVSQGFILPSDVAFMRSYTGPFSDTLNSTVSLGGTHSEENVVMYEYATTPSPSGLSVLAGAGLLAARRRRRA
jgi:hypothetical protein